MVLPPVWYSFSYDCHEVQWTVCEVDSHLSQCEIRKGEFLAVCFGCHLSYFARKVRSNSRAAVAVKACQTT